MINLVTGLPGSGKTLYTLKVVQAMAEKDNRQVFYHGIPDLTLPWVLMEKPEDWITLPNGSIIVIDECQSTFRPRAASVKPPLHVSEFETHRHKGLDFFLLTQHPMLIDGNIRRLAGRHFHAVRFYGFQKSTVHEFQQVRENVDKNTAGSIANHFLFPKEVFNWYKSADQHTIKRRLPMRLFLMVALPIFFVGILVYGYTTIKGLDQGKKELVTKSGVSAATSGTAAALPVLSPQAAYLQAHLPIEPNLPQSAPIYADVVKPVTAPYPAACVASVSKGCTCYSQQGTKLFIDELICRNIVANGFFVDWDTSGKSDKKTRNSDLVDAKHVDKPLSTSNEVSSRFVALNMN